MEIEFFLLIANQNTDSYLPLNREKGKEIHGAQRLHTRLQSFLGHDAAETDVASPEHAK